MISDVLETLAAKDPATALQAAADLPESIAGMGSTVPGSALMLIAREFPDLLHEWTLKCDWSNENERYIACAAAVRLSDVNPDAAVRLFKESAPEQKKILGGYTLSALAEGDLPRAITLAGSVEEQTTEDFLLKNLIHRAASKSGERAYRALDQLENQDLAASLKTGVLTQWLRQDAGPAIAALENTSVETLQAVLSRKDHPQFTPKQNIELFIEHDPEAARKLLDRIPLTEANASIFRDSARQMSQSDLGSTLSWLEAFPESPIQEQLITTSFRAAIGNKPDEKVAGVLNSAGPHREQALRAAGFSWGATDPDKGLSFAETISDNERGPYLASLIRASLNNQDVQTTAELTMKVPAEGEVTKDYGNAISAIGRKFADSDRGAALEWVENLTGGLQSHAVRGIANSWVRRDPKAASEWVVSLPEGGLRNAGAAVIISQIESTDPEAAAQWREQLVEEGFESRD